MKINRGVILPAIILLTFILLAFSGCRYRISYDDVYSSPDETQTVTYTPETTEPSDTPEEIITPDPGFHPPEIPDDTFTEYVAVAYVEAVEDNFSPLTMEIEDEDARRYGTEEAAAAYYENAVGAEADEDDEPDDIITVEQPTDIEGEAVIGDEGGVAGLLTAYSTILRQGVNSIFPCQLMYIYCETADDFVTVGRGSELYQLMVNSGGLNVSSRLTADRLTVTADWVVRRNPDVIVKFVSGSVLGGGVTTVGAASDVALSIASRPDWSAIDAVRNNRIILLSEQMLTSEETKLAAQLLIAYIMYPELFEGVDINAAVAGLMSGRDGIYFYRIFI